jgi:molybdopterin converting factor small subunit
MKLTVEFFGLPRRLTGVKECQLEFGDDADLHDVIMELGQKFPCLAEEKIIVRGRELAQSFMFSINGTQMVQNLGTRLADNDRLLLISTISGG